MPTPVRAVIFDYGCVLSLPLDPACADRMARLAGIPEPEFVGAYMKHRLSYDRGDSVCARLLGHCDAPVWQAGQR